jgi:phenylalanyl-tRNA synthetase beta chain
VELLLDRLGIVHWDVVPGGHPAFHPGRQGTLRIRVPGLGLGGPRMGEVGVFGEVHPEVATAWDLPGRPVLAELNFEALAQAAVALRPYRQVPRFPAVFRDLALAISREVPAARVAETIRAAGGDLLESLVLFDLYEGGQLKAGQRSLAYSLAYRAPDRTLTDAEVEAVHNRIRQALAEQLGAELRS